MKNIPLTVETFNLYTTVTIPEADDHDLAFLESVIARINDRSTPGQLVRLTLGAPE